METTSNVIGLSIWVKMDYMLHYVEILYTNNTHALMAYLKYICKLIKDKMKNLEHVV